MIGKRILIVVLLSYAFITTNAQTFILDDGFDNGTSLQSGWTTSGGLGSSSGAGNFGRNAPNITLNTNAQVMTYSWTGAGNDPDNLIFCYRATGSAVDAAASSILVEESSNGIVFTTVGNINTIQTGITSHFSAPLLSATRFVRIRYTKGGTNNTVMDDFIIRKAGSCISGPKIKFLLSNGSCAAPTSCEGAHEVVFCQNGNVNLDVNNISLGLPIHGGAGKGTTIGSNLTNTTSVWTNNAAYSATQIAYVNALNTVSGCSVGTFTLVPLSNLLPPNANFLLFTGSSPTHTFNFSSICSLGPFYVIFSDYDCSGKFSNSTCSSQCLRSLQLVDMNTGCVDTRTFTTGGSTSTGAGIGFDPNVATTWSNVSTGCSNFAVLPIELSDFYGYRTNNSIALNWQVKKEINLNHYLLERSFNAVDFSRLAEVYPQMPANAQSFMYRYSDENPLRGINYYRLTNVDLDGSSKQHPIIAVQYNGAVSHLWHSESTSEITIGLSQTNHSSEFLLLDMAGKTVRRMDLSSGTYSIPKSELATGMYYIKDLSGQNAPYKLMVFN
jgi:hypothetical protein